ncbi:MAG: T9SS type A sorting domain-containing protein, partial [Candidatus Delongbacteria bacterium]|nr:T9SS type A sorting domain-containing protein [Candidatus Delongbacteria bacterium]
LREIIWGGCSSDAGAVFAVNQDASSVDGWPQTTGQWIFGTVSLGDIDQDGSIDVVIGDQVSSGTPMDYIYAWDSSGNDIAGFPAGPTNAIYSQIGIADLDGDDNVELMIDDNNFGFGYNAYNHDGTQCVDWPLACGTVWSSTTMGITPVFGDVDNDNELEIIGAATDIMNWVVECYLWDTDAVWNEDLAYMIIDGVNMQHNGLYDPSYIPINYPPQNVVVDEIIGAIYWDPPEMVLNRELLGYNVYLDDMITPIGTTSDTEYQYENLIPGYTYLAGVSAVYDDGESEIIEVEFIYSYVIFFPPQNLAVECIEDHAHLTWEAPVSNLNSSDRKTEAEETRDLTGYNVYLDQIEFANNISDLEYDFYDLANGEYYAAGVRAIYDIGESEIVELTFIYLETGAEDDILCNKIDLLSNFPNPFNPTTTISFDIAEGETGILTIFNLKGQLLELHEFNSGNYDCIWDATNQASGIYFYKLQTQTISETRKMLLLK